MPSYSLAELAGLIGVRLEGDPVAVVAGVAPLAAAAKTDLSFLAHPRYTAAARQSKAGALIADDGYPGDGQNVLRSDNPYLAFARATALLAPEMVPAPGVAPTAVIAAGTALPDDASIGPHAVIGAGVSLGAAVCIGAGCVVEDGVVLGDGTRLFPRVTIHRGTRLGRRCIVQSGTVLGADGFGYATDGDGRHVKIPQRGGLEIGDDVEIGANVTVDRGSAGDTVIGAGTKIDNLVQIGHNVRIGQNAILVAQVGIAGSTRIGDFAVIGGQAGIAGHRTIGARARIAAQSGVIGDIPEGAEVSGYPARPHRGQMRTHALLARLPELLKRVRALETRTSSRPSRPADE